MSGISILLDTNIVLYLLNGDTVLQQYLEGKSYYLSFINELELFGYKSITETEAKAIEFFLDECAMFDFNAGIKEITYNFVVITPP